MSNTDFFTSAGRFYRGNLHTHSTNSDGTQSPEEVCRRYRAEGYDFIALTDHMVGLYDYQITDTRPYRGPDFTTLIGAELHTGAMENGELWHILAVGLPDDFEPPKDVYDWWPKDGQESGPSLARRARDAGAFVTIAHPEWSGLSDADARSLDAAHAVEIYNHSCAVAADRAHGFYILDRLLSEGRARSLVATDDAHFHGADAFGGWVMVKAAENAPEALLASLKAGHFYASTGPEFRAIRWEADRVIVDSSAVTTVIVQGHGSAADTVFGASLTRTEVPLEICKSSPWLRVTIIDAAGKRAWSQPHFRDLT